VSEGGGIEKLPPQNLEAEQSVLGAVMLENNALLKCIELISPEDFYRDSHRKIYTAMLDLFDRGEAIDLVTTTEQLTKKDNLESVGGTTYLASLAAQVPTAANIMYHARIVREKALMRSLLHSSTDIASKVYEDSDDAEELLDFAEKIIFEISDRRIKSAFVPMKDVIRDSFKMIETLYEKKEAVTGVPSGFSDLDEMTTGFQKGDLVVVGGRPSMGKTAFAMNIAQHVGMELRETVAVFSLEMSINQLVIRMLCSEAMVDSNKVRQGFINRQDDWAKLTGAAGRLSDAPIYIDDSASIGVLEMRAKARRLKMEHGLSLIVVDYLQLMRGRSNAERREQEISEISRSLKALARELDVPVIALSQLNRGVEMRNDKRPNLSDLRESGAIEQDADVIIFLYRDEVYDKDNPNVRGLAEVLVSKQRNGPTGKVRLTFLNQYTKFADHSSEFAEEGMEEVNEPF
jgi:replicative DNA helicase